MNNTLLQSCIRHLLAAAVLLPLGLNAAHSVAAPRLISLSPGSGRESTTPVGISLSGDQIAGFGYNNPPFTDVQAFRWTRTGGTKPIPLPAKASDMYVNAISGDGSTLAGYVLVQDGSPFGVQRPVLWTARRGTVDLAALPDGTDLHGVSAEGSVVCGNIWVGYSQHAIRWSPRDGLTDLGTAGGGDEGYSLALGISADGRSIAGLTTTDSGEAAFLWTVRDGLRALAPAHPDEPSGGYAISANGRVIVGYSGLYAAAWYNGAPKDLGGLPGGTFSVAYAASGDGRVIGGLADSATSFASATLWFRRAGAVDLNLLLPALGVDLSGWTLDTVSALSADGSTIAGTGTHDGVATGWTIRLPDLEEDARNCLGIRDVR